MLVSFLGSPCSGKTTTAAMLFTDVKEKGLPAEFLAEYARFHIARKRVNCKRKGGVFTLSDLTDEDQYAIFKTQAEQEELFVESLGDVVAGMVISDTSCLNALLYMSRPLNEQGKPTGVPTLWEDPNLKESVRIHMKKTSPVIFFHSYPIDMPIYVNGADPNRVHTQAQGKEIDDLVPELIRYFNLDSHTPLMGSIDTRLARANSNIASRLHSFVDKKARTA